MKLAVYAPDLLYQELLESLNDKAVLYRIYSLDAITADALFYFDEDYQSMDFTTIDIPVFINEVNKTLAEINFPANISRMNAWPGFIKRELWEVVTSDNSKIASITDAIGKKIEFLKDEPGMISPRIIAMIINEAYFALGEGVSSKAEIDIAMKAGVNYPYGPFEWSEKIGLEKIYNLLKQLSATDKRYQPAPAMIEELSTHRKEMKN